MYLIFGGEEYYARGGALDYLASSDDKAKALELARSLLGMCKVTRVATWSEDRDKDYKDIIEWVNIIDTDTGRIIAHFNEDGHDICEDICEGSVALEIRNWAGDVIKLLDRGL